MMSMENHLDCQALQGQWYNSNLWSAASDTPQELLLVTIVFKLFINNLDKGMG